MKIKDRDINFRGRRRNSRSGELNELLSNNVVALMALELVRAE